MKDLKLSKQFKLAPRQTEKSSASCKTSCQPSHAGSLKKEWLHPPDSPAKRRRYYQIAHSAHLPARSTFDKVGSGCLCLKEAGGVGALVPIWCPLLLPSSPKHKDFLHEKSTREDPTLTATFDTTGSMQLGLWSLFGCAVWHVGERADSGAIPYNEAHRTQETGLLELLKWLTND